MSDAPALRPAVATALLDVTTLPHARKHAAVLARCESLAIGDLLLIRNPRPPDPIRQELETAYPGALRWMLLSQRPGCAEVVVEKRRAFTPAEITAHHDLLHGKSPGHCGVSGCC